jgi:chromosome segregation ATPase
MNPFTTTNPTQATAISFNPDLLPVDAEGRELAQRIYNLIPQYDSLVERKRQSDITAHSSKHEALVMESRKLEKQKDELKEEQTLLASEAAEIDKAVGDARFALKLTKEDAALDPLWAIKADWDAYNAKVQSAESTLAKATANQQRHNETVAGWRERWITLQESKVNLTNEVEQEWIKLERAKGRTVSAVDSETGLIL